MLITLGGWGGMAMDCVLCGLEVILKRLPE
jgi:hypothetical protein